MSVLAFTVDTAEELRKMLEHGDPIYLMRAEELADLKKARECFVLGHDGAKFIIHEQIPKPGQMQLPGTGIFLGNNAAHALRQMLRPEKQPEVVTPHWLVITEDEAAIVAAERELEAARVDGLLLRVEYHSPSRFNQPTNSLLHTFTLYVHNDIPHLYEGATKITALEPAVEYVRELRAAQELKPVQAAAPMAPHSMTQHAREDELHERGWEHAWAGPADSHHMQPVWMPKDGTWSGDEEALPCEDESWSEYTTRVLAHVRHVQDTAQ